MVLKPLNKGFQIVIVVVIIIIIIIIIIANIIEYWARTRHYSMCFYIINSHNIHNNSTYEKMRYREDKIT